MAFAFEKLLVYQKAVDFSDRICELSGNFPRGFYFLTDQINRAALSISTNIAEGNGRFATPDKRKFFGISHNQSNRARQFGRKTAKFAHKRRYEFYWCPAGSNEPSLRINRPHRKVIAARSDIPSCAGIPRCGT
ncbi:MAG: four helix bundle protein [Tepidisphaeraceae bacterium]|jgi:four helix bundle protein